MIALKVREFTNADDIIAHAKACRERIRNAKARPKPIAPTILVPREPRKPAIPPKPEGLTIYAWPIGPYPLHDVMYVATPPTKEDGVEKARTIINEVSKKHGFTIPELMSMRRRADLVRARHECFYRIKKDTVLSFPHIGHIMGDRDHTTILHGVKRFERLLAEGVVTL